MEDNTKAPICACGQPAMAGRQECWDCTRKACEASPGGLNKGTVGKFWTEARVAEAKVLIDARLSASQVSERISASSGKRVSRNAVIGIAKRRGIEFKMAPGYRAGTHAGMVGKRNSKPRPAVQQQEAPARKALPAPATGAIQIDQDEEIKFADQEIKQVHPDQRKQLFDLEVNDCRWPFGDVGRPGFGFCGCKTVPGLPYCEDHARNAFPARRISGGPAEARKLIPGGNFATGGDRTAPQPKNPASEPLRLGARIEA